MAETGKNKGGRPAKTEADRRTARISIHWRQGEMERVSSAADMLGLSVADFLRMSGLERARKVLEEAGRMDLLMGKPRD